jgi:hypothetical protein
MKEFTMDALDRTLDLAKRGKFTRPELYSHICALADAQFGGPGRSSAQNFSKFLATPEGSQLYQLQKALPGKDLADPTAPVIKSSSDDDWARLIALTRKATGCSENQAISAALATEGGAHAFRVRKRSDQIATGQFTVADMACLDAAAGEQEGNREFDKAASPYRTEYEAECAAIQQMHPDMKQSDVHDMARAENPEAWREHRDGRAQKLGHKKPSLPQSRGQHERSGEAPPKPTSGRSGQTPPQWHSQHSGSLPTTPQHAPESLSNNPVVKYMAERMPLDRAIWFYNRFPNDVKQALGTLFR